MATSSIAPPLLRPSMLLISICTVALGLTACETDSTEAVSVQADSIQSASVQSDSVPSDSGQTITENITSSSDNAVTLNRSASAMSMRAMPTSQYLVGSGKADITGAAAETGMFGYAAGRWYKVSTTVCTLMLLLSAKRTKIRANASSMYQQIWARCLPR